MFFTVVACHRPPRAVVMPRALRASATSRKVIAPARCASRMIGRTLAACVSASALMRSIANALAADSLRFGAPRATPRALAALSPPQSLEALTSAVLLFVASAIYAFRCPPRVKQFSSEMWTNQLGQPIVTYWPLAWRWPIWRTICAATFLIGGVLAMWVVGGKLVSTFVYVWRNI
jgi:hypothetical protein